jgi:hypothetical protein
MDDLLALLGVDRMESLMDDQIHAVQALHSPADTNRWLWIVGMPTIPPTVGGNLTGANEVDEPLLAAEAGSQFVGVLLALLPRHGAIYQSMARKKRAV